MWKMAAWMEQGGGAGRKSNGFLRALPLERLNVHLESECHLSSELAPEEAFVLHFVGWTSINSYSHFDSLCQFFLT